MKNTKKNVLILPGIQQLDSMISNSELSDEYNFTNAKYSTVEFIFEGEEVTVTCDGTSLNEFDHIWLTSNWSTRDISYAISLYLDFHSISHTPTEISSSKLTDHMQFALAGIITPKTYFSKSKNNKYDVDKIANTLNFPIVIKNIRGACGKDVYLANNKTELKEMVEELDSKTIFMFQEFVENNYDWGVLISNDTVVSAERSYGDEGEFKNNASCGATEEFCLIKNVPAEISNIALSAMKAVNLEWGRADIIIEKGTDRPFLLEVNRHPGITAGSTEVDAGMNHIIGILAG